MIEKAVTACNPSPLAGEGGAQRRVRGSIHLSGGYFRQGKASLPNRDDLYKSSPPFTHPPAAGALSRQGRGRLTARALCQALAASMAGLIFLTTPALAAAGGDVDPFVFRLSIFVLAIFVGYYVVWSVTPALHTPLMSVTNAISSVIVVGALLAVAVEAADLPGTTTAKTFGFLALIMASVNIFGGFLVTQRMLAMYKKKEKKQ
jgi:NAD(P) transhydrogenase subunit alpha